MKKSLIEIENDILENLRIAKNNVFWLLENPNGSIDMHGLVYWAEVVERLRKDIRNNLRFTDRSRNTRNAY
jgi:hypothetical protein